jgi:hypothetical protein
VFNFKIRILTHQAILHCPTADSRHLPRHALGPHFVHPPPAHPSVSRAQASIFSSSFLPSLPVVWVLFTRSPYWHYPDRYVLGALRDCARRQAKSVTMDANEFAAQLKRQVPFPPVCPWRKAIFYYNGFFPSFPSSSSCRALFPLAVLSSHSLLVWWSVFVFFRSPLSCITRAPCRRSGGTNDWQPSSSNKSCINPCIPPLG